MVRRLPMGVRCDTAAMVNISKSCTVKIEPLLPYHTETNSQLRAVKRLYESRLGDVLSVQELWASAAVGE